MNNFAEVNILKKLTIDSKRNIFANDITINGYATMNGNFLLPAVSTVAGSLSYNPNNQQLVIGDGTAGQNILASGGGTILTYRPGYTGSSTNGVYGNWDDMYSDLQKIHTSKVIEFDDSLLISGDPITIPTGNWNMSDTRWYSHLCRFTGVPVFSGVQIEIGDNTTIDGLCEVSGTLRITYTSTTNPAITAKAGTIYNYERNAIVSFTNGTVIACTGTQPFVKIEDVFYEVVTLFGVRFLNGGTPIIQADTNFPNAGIIVLGSSCELEDNVVSGNGALVLLRYSPGNNVTIPLQQPITGTGTIIIQNNYTTSDTYQYITNPTLNDDSDIGYKVGDTWINTSTKKYWVAVDVSVGGAVWNGPY